MGIGQILAIIGFAIFYTIFFIVLRAFVLYYISKEMTEEEFEDYLKELEKHEAEELSKRRDL